MFSHTYSRVTRRREEASLAFFKNRKKCHDFRKKGPDCVHHWVKFSIQNVVLRVGEQTPKCFPVGLFFLVFLTKTLSKGPSSTNIPPP